MNNPMMKMWATVSQIPLEKGEFINLDVDYGRQNVEIAFFEDGTLQICASADFIGRVKVLTFAQAYPEVTGE